MSALGDPRSCVDGLLRLTQVALIHGEPVPAVVRELARELDALAKLSPVSVYGNSLVGCETIDVMSEWFSPDAAGAEVGLTGSRVRQLCRAGRVEHRQVSGRHLVRLADLHRHLSAVVL